MSAPLVATFVRDTVAAWPETDANKVAPRVDLMSLPDVFTHTHNTDLHYVAYHDPNGLPFRLNSHLFDPDVRAAAIRRRAHLTAEQQAAFLAADYRVQMIAFVVDVDDPVAHEQDTPARPDWRIGEHISLTVLLSECPGGFHYDTKKGYRLVYAINPFTIASDADKLAWRRRYKLLLASLVRRYGIVGDPACADFTRCFRAPRVVRDGKAEKRPIYGDPHAIGLYSFEPCEADLARARELAKTDSRWRVDDEDRERAPRPPTLCSASAPADDDDENVCLDPISWDLRSAPVRAAIDLLVQHFPKIGVRHDLSMAIAGMLRRGGATEEDAHAILLEVFERGGSNKAHVRADIVRSTWSLPKPMRGFTFAASLLGENVVKRVGDLFTDAYNTAWLGSSISPRRAVAPTPPTPPTPPTAPDAPPVPPPTPAISVEPEITPEELRRKLQRTLRTKVAKLRKTPPATEKQRFTLRWLIFDIIMLRRLLNRSYLDDRARDGATIGDAANAIEHVMRLVGAAVPRGTGFRSAAVADLVDPGLVMSGATNKATDMARWETAFNSGAAKAQVRTAKWNEKTQDARAFNAEKNRRLYGRS